jgi:metal-sulfur cluster biosynthetic enzyme
MTSNPLTSASAAQAMESSTSPLPVVREPASDCADEPGHHDHNLHSHGGGCCATTSPYAAAVAAEKAVAMTETCESHRPDAGVCDAGATPPASESILDDAALIDALREVIDPELMINIVDLGLVYSINHTDRKVAVDMTLTSPACPAGPQIIMQSKMALEKLDGVDVAEIKLVMSPPWTPARMTDEARDQLGIF